jgi:hypothetical protein
VSLTLLALLLRLRLQRVKLRGASPKSCAAEATTSFAARNSPWCLNLALNRLRADFTSVFFPLIFLTSVCDSESLIRVPESVTYRIHHNALIIL